jgi:hypothetical protein
MEVIKVAIVGLSKQLPLPSDSPCPPFTLL